MKNTNIRTKNGNIQMKNYKYNLRACNCLKFINTHRKAIKHNKNTQF